MRSRVGLTGATAAPTPAVVTGAGEADQEFVRAPGSLRQPR
ncbi:MAG TPA: hypothetical protein VGA69_08445 [Nitriliruptorales bacterium]